MKADEEREEIIRNAEEACRQGIITLDELLWLRCVTVEVTSEYTERKLE